MPPVAHRQSRHLPDFLLLVLADGPLHGHAIRAVLLERFPGYRADPGAMYRALQMLEEAGDVGFHWDTGSRGPARKVYTLTPAGWAHLESSQEEMEHRLGFIQAFLDHFRRSKAARNSHSDMS